MQTWLNFWNLFFWLLFTSFALNSTNFTKLLFISEIAWIVLYNYVIIVGSINDDLTIMSTCFLLLGFAGLEFSIGMLLVIIFKKLLKIDYFFESTIVQNNDIYLTNNN